MNEQRLIDANKLIKNAQVYSIECGEYISEDVREIKAVLLDRIEEAPTIDVNPIRRGQWKYYHKQNKAVCTYCSFERDLDMNFGRAVSCPNCGAVMDGDE